MRKLIYILIFGLITICSSCSRDRDGSSANDIDPNFVPSTLSLNVFETDMNNLECFYENNFIEFSVDDPSVLKSEWYLVQNNNLLILGSEKKQSVSQAGQYRIKMEIDKDGVEIDSIINFSLSFCDAYLFVPDVFKPNGDGVFDYWGPSGEGIEKIYFRVNTRRGKKLFESSSLESLWDGTYDGDKMKSGTYKYVIEGTYKNGYLFEKTGSFELIR